MQSSMSVACSVSPSVGLAGCSSSRDRRKDTASGSAREKLGSLHASWNSHERTAATATGGSQPSCTERDGM